MANGFLIALLLFNIACIVICHRIAAKRGARPVFWGIIGALLGPLAIPLVLIFASASND
ncbi:MAG: hypothetical protein ACI8XC_003945 [Gammaproteobacteria bacterium]|jgi:hypothetical protein